MKIFKLTILVSLALLSNNAVFAKNASDRYMYIGTELGISEPVVKSFVYESQSGETRMRLKQSRMFGGRIGYSFYPNMSVEISGTHQPRYRLGYKLPSVDVAVGAGLPPVIIPSISDTTKVSSNVLTLNLLYEFDKQKFDLKPYAIFGIGVARINISPNKSFWKPEVSLLALGFADSVEFFRIKKNIHNCLAYQFGGGISKDIGENFSVDLGAKLQIVRNITIKYETLDMTTNQFVEQSPIKKTIGVGEFTLGFTFKFPVK
jgi:opacity protein-like surface antigen